MTVTAPLRVGIIGLGRMGQNHLRVLSSLKSVELGFIYDIDRETAGRLASAAGVSAPESLEEGLSGVEAVVIASPTSTHEEYIRRSAEQVGNLFVEKPLTDGLESSVEIARFAEEKSAVAQR